MVLLRNKYFIVAGLTLILIVISFFAINYVENEGFNPTDEGVVLAQSWRIINGEVPHSDFISIRPAASGFLHSIIFAFPGPLVSNARWFVLFQYFAIALVMSLMLFREIERVLQLKIHFIYLFSLLISGFTVVVLNYNLYSWTTIDAVFWSVLAMPLVFSSQKWKIALGLLLTALAALSRQTFAVVTIAGYLYVFFRYRKSFTQYILVFVVGALPFIAYLLMLVFTSALPDFISQMTGRSEFFQTAILQYFKRFALGMTSPLNIICLFICAILYFKRKTDFSRMFLDKGLHAVLSLVYICFAFAIVIRHFLLDEIDIYNLPFDLFFMLVFFTIFHFLLRPESKTIRMISIAVLLISWTSSISLGDNSPVFTAGILFLSLIVMCYDVILGHPSKFTKPVTNKVLLLVLAFAITGLGLYSQSRINYRDTSSDQFVAGLGDASPEFGDIRANRHVVAYYNELSEIFCELPNSLDNTVVFPHNAMFYPVMKTKNPAPLDWITANEYIGQEERIIDDFNLIFEQETVYFIIEKVDVRVICLGLRKRVYESDLVYDMITQNCHKIDLDSEFFDVYCNRPVILNLFH